MGRTSTAWPGPFRRPVHGGALAVPDGDQRLVDPGFPDPSVVRDILEHAHEHPWAMQDVGLLGLRLDDRSQFRLHVWAPGRRVGPPVIHDHPFDFVSRVVVGELTNTRYHEDPAGEEYVRDRYRPADEGLRTTDAVRLAPRAETYREGGEYAQAAGELHDSRQIPGTVTVIRRWFRSTDVLTVCRVHGAPWVSGVSRPATPGEIEEIASTALARF